MTEKDIQLFIIQNAVIERSIRSAEERHGANRRASEIERLADSLIDEYIQQFDYQNVATAARMSEYYRLFFMLENEIRSLISETLEEEFGSSWWPDQIPQAVDQAAKQAKTRELQEAVTPRSPDMIYYTTFGELGEIIKFNWKIFGGIFSGGSLAGVQSVLRRLNTIRGPIAHCGDLSEDEVVRLKLTIRDWFRLME